MNELLRALSQSGSQRRDLEDMRDGDRKQSGRTLNREGLEALMEALANIAKGSGAGLAGSLVDMTSTAMRPFGFDVPAEDVPLSSEWLGDLMGADTEGLPFLAGQFASPDAVDFVKLASMLPVVTTKAGKKKVALGTLWDEVTDVGEATEMARKGKHIKRDKSGKYVGAPENIDSPQKLGALRKKIDEKVDAGSVGMGWYDEARGTYESFAPNNPRMQSLLARGTAAYSPQASPSSETGAFLTQYNTKMLTGEDVRPRTKSQMRNVARAYENQRHIGDTENLNPESITLGKKTGPYADAKDPTVPEESLYKTANDIWHGRVMGYGEDFSRGFTPQEHGWLTGENLLLADRAKARDLATGTSRPTEWTPRAGQAATWVAKRKEQYIKDAIASHAAKNAKRKKPLPPLDMELLEKEAEAYAKSGIADATDRHSAYLTREARTGRGIGDIEMDNSEEDLIASYSALVQAENPRDEVLDALGLYSKNARGTKGFFVNDMGEIERNPGYVNQVLASSNIAGAPRTNAADRAALDYTALIDAIIGSQQAGSWSRFFPENMGKQRVSGMNAVLMPNAGVGPAERKLLEGAAAAGNFSPIDYGSSTLLTRFGDEGPAPGTTREIVEALATAGVPGKGVRGTIESSYLPTLLGPEVGTGRTTEHLLERSEDWGKLIPGLEERTASAVADKAKTRSQINQLVADATGKSQRPDMVKMREILQVGDEQGRGIPALRRYVKKYGSKGLPAVLLGYLGIQVAGGEPERNPDA